MLTGQATVGNMFNFFSIFVRGMTRTDGLFHLGLASILIIGTICAGSVGDFIWGHWNRGVRP